MRKSEPDLKGGYALELADSLESMTSSLVTVDVRDSVGTVHLNRLDERNVFWHEILHDLCEAFRILKSHQSVRVVILTGVPEGPLSLDGYAGEGLEVLYDQIANFEVPVIAVISGVCADDGFELALACHLRIASNDAEFRMPESRIDETRSSVARKRLNHIIGRERALEITSSWRTISAEEAFRIGLVNRLADKDCLIREANSLAGEISQLAPLAIRSCLQAVREGLEMPFDEGLALEAELFSELFATADVREGTSAFLEKRAPVFKGR